MYLCRAIKQITIINSLNDLTMEKKIKISADNFSGKKLNKDIFQVLQFRLSLKSDGVSFEHSGLAGTLDFRKDIEEKADWHFNGISSLRELTGISQSDVDIFLKICHQEFVGMLKEADSAFMERNKKRLEDTSMYIEAFQ